MTLWSFLDESNPKFACPGIQECIVLLYSSSIYFINAPTTSMAAYLTNDIIARRLPMAGFTVAFYA